jgi:hypothetical protein
MKVRRKLWFGLLAGVAALTAMSSEASAQQQNRPNIVMLMTDDTGWQDFGAYSGGGAALGHPTPNVDRIAKEGAVFTNWYRPGELHGRPCVLHNWTHPDSVGALDRGCSG